VEALFAVRFLADVFMAADEGNYANEGSPSHCLGAQSAEIGTRMTHIDGMGHMVRRPPD
jgi:hypothetical protein